MTTPAEDARVALAQWRAIDAARAAALAAANGARGGPWSQEAAELATIDDAIVAIGRAKDSDSARWRVFERLLGLPLERDTGPATIEDLAARAIARWQGDEGRAILWPDGREDRGRRLNQAEVRTVVEAARALDAFLAPPPEGNGTLRGLLGAPPDRESLLLTLRLAASRLRGLDEWDESDERFGARFDRILARGPRGTRRLGPQLRRDRVLDAMLGVSPNTVAKLLKRATEAARSDPGRLLDEYSDWLDGVIRPGDALEDWAASTSGNATLNEDLGALAEWLRRPEETPTPAPGLLSDDDATTS